MALLRRIILNVRDMEKATTFWVHGLGLSVKTTTPEWSLLQSGPIQIHLKQTYNEGELSTGYSPFLQFDVQDLPNLVPKLLALGAYLDGSIAYTGPRTIASLRSPDGHMVSLVEEDEEYKRLLEYQNQPPPPPQSQQQQSQQHPSVNASTNTTTPPLR